MNMQSKFLILKHKEAEKEFFMIFPQKGKAGSKILENHFQKQFQKIIHSRDEIKKRIQVNSELSIEDQMKYYSS